MQDFAIFATVIAFFIVQLLYFLGMAAWGYLRTLPANFVNPADVEAVDRSNLPFIVMYYPVLRELEETMRTTMSTIARIDYPSDHFRIVAIPNANDLGTINSLNRLRSEFSFLEVLEVPPTSDPSWSSVWNSWSSCPKAYWWHAGRYTRNKELPPKKTRQLVYAFYKMAEEWRSRDVLVSYIDADSCVPGDLFLAAAAGMKDYDVLQAQNIGANLFDSMAASWHAADHMSWDGLTYPHLSADGKQPYYVLGKGMFFWASDLVELGGFHPWLAIEDPEVGMRFWKGGRKLGIIESPLIEEVPVTLGKGITQRKRWVCGFFQTHTEAARMMGMSGREQFRAWLNFVPCLSLAVNAIGLPVGLIGLYLFFSGESIIPVAGAWLATANVAFLLFIMASVYLSAWRRSAIVVDSIYRRIWFLVRINPLSLLLYWLLWIIPLALGFRMFVGDGGMVWERTEKINANEGLVEELVSASVLRASSSIAWEDRIREARVRREAALARRAAERSADQPPAPHFPQQSNDASSR